MVTAKIRKYVLIALLAYFAIGLVHGIYAEYSFRRFVGRCYMVLGKQGFANTSELKELFHEPEVRRFDTFLKLTPPVGWIVFYRIKRVEDRFLYASANYALPMDQRFSNPDEARSYGFDPEKKSDEEIADATFKTILW